MRKRYLVYVTRSETGDTDRIAIPMRYVYVFLASALVGMFTIAGMAGSYARMLAKTETTNRLRFQLAQSRSDYANLEKTAHERDVQAASLGSLATEVSAIYGLTAGKLTFAHGHSLRPGKSNTSAAQAAQASVNDESAFSDASYYKSLDTFYALRNTAQSGLVPPSPGLNANLGVRASLGDLAGGLDLGSTLSGSNIPDMWPILGPINSGFGQREDPVLGLGTGEFHKGIDIGAPNGTPVHAPAAGRVLKAGLGNGYGNEIEIDHGNGIVTVYGHLSAFNVTAGQQIVKGEVIGFVGHTGRVTGPHLHYEVQVRGTAVNPHKYLRTTMADLGGGSAAAGS
jgi:murein DD-endopeptidase MepM/ murein hydrolase activator NlpD